MKPKSLRIAWQLLQPIRSVRVKDAVKLPKVYNQFFNDLREYRRLDKFARLEDLQPCLFDRNFATQSGGGHYFFQDVWALKRIADAKPLEHHDVGSRLDGFVGQATAICPVIFWDIRPVSIRLPNFTFRHGCLTDLPIPNQSIRSISCLHVVEHVGLGRYGDSIDPLGTEKALTELMRVLAVGGQLLISLPIGKERVCFNGQRISHPDKPLDLLNELTLLEFSAVTDVGEFVEAAPLAAFVKSKNSCGLYRFTRK